MQKNSSSAGRSSGGRSKNHEGESRPHLMQVHTFSSLESEVAADVDKSSEMERGC
jgi:hypothetical protein